MRLVKIPHLKRILLEVFGNVLNRDWAGEMFFFLRFSTDAIVLLAHWVREGVYCYAVGTTPSGTGAAFYPWKSFPSCR